MARVKLTEVEQRIGEAVARSGRKRSDVTLVAIQGTPEDQADRAVREALKRAGLELPKESPDGGYRVD